MTGALWLVDGGISIAKGPVGDMVPKTLRKEPAGELKLEHERDGLKKGDEANRAAELMEGESSRLPRERTKKGPRTLESAGLSEFAATVAYRPSRSASPGMARSTLCQAALVACFASFHARLDLPLPCS